MTKKEARNEVNKALQSGRLTKPAACACGNVRVEAHHSNYDRPLEIEWLCSRCYKKRHPEVFAPTRCPKGHPYSGDNLRIVVLKDGYTRRRCKTCHKEQCKRYWPKYVGKSL